MIKDSLLTRLVFTCVLGRCVVATVLFTQTFRRALTSSVDSCAEIKTAPSVTYTVLAIVWRKVPESDVQSVVWRKVPESDTRSVDISMRLTGR